MHDYETADNERRLRDGTPLTPTFVLDFLKNRPLDFEPGTRWSYSNSAFYIAGLIIERVSGHPYGSYVREMIAEPLGLHDTFLCDDDLLSGRRTRGYTPSDSGLMPSPLF